MENIIYLGDIAVDEIMAQSIVVMERSLQIDCPLEEIKELADNAATEKELAHAYALANNRTWWLADDIDDYRQGTEEYKKAADIFNSWRSMENILREKIFSVLREKGEEIANIGYIAVLSPFMERNGYRNAGGWWVEIEEKNGNNQIGEKL